MRVAALSFLGHVDLIAVVGIDERIVAAVEYVTAAGPMLRQLRSSTLCPVPSIR